MGAFRIVPSQVRVVLRSVIIAQIRVVAEGMIRGRLRA